MKTKMLGIAAGTAMGMALTAGAVNAEVNPFEMTKLNSGYSVAMSDSPDEGKCGEGKCGGDKAKKEAKCGEGKCGGDKAKKEAKCGEGKCGGK